MSCMNVGTTESLKSRTKGVAVKCALMAALTLVGVSLPMPARALTVELKDVAPDRIERQRAASIGQIPLPNTPNVGQFTERLAEKNMTLGSSIFVRIFKEESELEIWMQRGAKYELFATYPICHWSGTLGPKLNEGDKQSPEGIYSVTSRQLHLIGRHPRSLNLGFPNALDRSYSRTGSYILIHGGCSSVGCFAMTNPVISEIYVLSQAALAKGQGAIQIQVMPFRLTEDRLRAHALNEWYDFWRNLKDAYDSFERTHLPPQVTVCEGRYWIDDAATTEEVASHGPLAVCAISRDIAGLLRDELDSAAQTVRPLAPSQAPSQLKVTQPTSAQSLSQQQWAQLPLQPSSAQPQTSPPTPSLQSSLSPPRSATQNPTLAHWINDEPSQLSQSPGQLSGRLLKRRDLLGNLIRSRPDQDPYLDPTSPPKTTMKMHQPNRELAQLQKATLSSSPRTTSSLTIARVPISCDLSLTSCRKHIALKRQVAAKKITIASGRPVKMASRR
jgi:murein L,D-transpeptidase YafK